MNVKHTIGATVAAAIAGSTIGIASFGAGLAGAQDDPPVAPDTSDAEPGDTEEAPSSGRPRHHRGGHSAEIADLLGLSTEELRDAMTEGQTLAEVAEANGVSRDDLVAAIKEQHQQKLDDALADGRIDADQATERSAQLDERIETMVDRTLSERSGFGHGFRRGVGRGVASAEIADLLGLSTEELRDAMTEGQTLAEVAEANGVSTETLVTTIVAGIEEKMAEQVEAGRITQDRADTFLENAEDRIEDSVNGEGSNRGFGRGRGFGRFGRGGFGPGADGEARFPFTPNSGATEQVPA